MARFRRRGRDGESVNDEPVSSRDVAETVGAAGGEDGSRPGGGATVEARPPVAGMSDRSEGPFDASEVPGEDTERLDLGGMRLVIPADVELRLDLDQQQQVVAATLVHGEELMQLGAFAAPRTEGIWDEVRGEILESILAGGGSASEGPGRYGVELAARIPSDQPGVLSPARFVGVDGPRWFLRALFSGPLTARGDEDPVLAAALRSVVVVRGPEAMAPRDGLPLRLPRDAQASAEAALAAAADQNADAQNPLGLPERGPEITETR